MSKPDDGGPAFPTTVPDPEKHPFGYAVNGMTLRQWLATHAPKDEAEWSVGECEQKLGLKKGGYNFEIHWPILDARWRYAWADAMIAEGKKPVELAAESELDPHREALEDVLKHAKTVMRYLEESGPSVVPHLIDTDDNPGEFLRQAIAKAGGKS